MTFFELELRLLDIILFLFHWQANTTYGCTNQIPYIIHRAYT